MDDASEAARLSNLAGIGEEVYADDDGSTAFADAFGINLGARDISGRR
jgi:hypothetical protein